MARKQYLNPAPPDKPRPDAPKDVVHVYFASKLQKAIVDLGMNQSDLAREVQKHLPKGRTIGRDSISLYIRGKVLPNAINLKAIAAALKVDAKDLLPHKGVPSVIDNHPTRDTRLLGDGNTWLRINEAVPTDLALKIVSMLNANEKKARGK
ncbi:MAG: helix-turn-helix transcriptional regulator [Rhizobiales bacterium]|nr:helix-turn-helix transcriptional regulator [Hyphomicrobiales bacterium]